MRRRRLLLMVVVVVVAGIAASCASLEPDQGLTPIDPGALLDYNEFVCAAQPVLIRRCSYLACHGNVGHALRLYSPGKLRFGDVATRDNRDAVLTADEVERNFASAAALLLGATADDRTSANLDRLPLLAKPLAARWGGYEHAGVAIFPVPPIDDPNNDPEFRALIDWVAGVQATAPLSMDCADLFTSLELTPR